VVSARISNSPQTRYFEDFGLPLMYRDRARSLFRLPEGSTVEIKQHDNASLPTSALEGFGVREVIWGVSDREALDSLVADLRRDHNLAEDRDGAFRFTTNFGLAMGVRVFNRKPVICAPDPLNAPGYICRLNQHRKWRKRSYPKGIGHVVFATPTMSLDTA
jgi:hypothetical protein